MRGKTKRREGVIRIVSRGAKRSADYPLLAHFLPRCVGTVLEGTMESVLGIANETRELQATKVG